MSIFGNNTRTARSFSGLAQSGAFRAGSLGHLGLAGPYRNSQIRGASGLGEAASGTVPWQCWSAPGFQDCYSQQWGLAQSACNGGLAAKSYNGDTAACIDSESLMNAYDTCIPKYCGTTIAQQTVNNSGKVLDAATVKKIQTTLNTQLAANKMKPISVDGKMGPATCGAARYLLLMNVSTVYNDYNLASGYCTTWTNPTLVGSTVPLKTTVMPTTNIVQGQPVAALTFPPWGAPDPQMAPLQAQINQILDANQFNMIPITGVLDAATCGAMKWIRDNTGQDMLSTSGMNCQAFTMPTKRPASISPQNAKPGSPPPVVAPPAPTPMSQGSLALGGILLLAAGGAYYYAKKKGLV